MRRSWLVRRASRSSSSGSLRNWLADALGERRIQQRLPGCDPPHRVDDVGAADLLQQVARRAGDDRLEQRLVVGERREHDAGDLGLRASGSRGTPRRRCRRAAARRGPRPRDGSAGSARARAPTVPASPTTSMSSSASRSSRTPRRTISWSSSRKTRIGVRVGRHRGQRIEEPQRVRSWRSKTTTAPMNQLRQLVLVPSPAASAP